MILGFATQFRLLIVRYIFPNIPNKHEPNNGLFGSYSSRTEPLGAFACSVLQVSNNRCVLCSVRCRTEQAEQTLTYTVWQTISICMAPWTSWTHPPNPFDEDDVRVFIWLETLIKFGFSKYFNLFHFLIFLYKKTNQMLSFLHNLEDNLHSVDF